MMHTRVLHREHHLLQNEFHIKRWRTITTSAMWCVGVEPKELINPLRDSIQTHSPLSDEYRKMRNEKVTYLCELDDDCAGLDSILLLVAACCFLLFDVLLIALFSFIRQLLYDEATYPNDHCLSLSKG